ncbi:MAG: preprotein translocase subunit YajC [Actinomycetota bacterium]
MELLIFPIAMIALTWLLLVRPQKARLREREHLVSALGIGDDVVTVGGLHGTVTEVDDEVVVLEVSDGVEVTYDKRAIARIDRSAAEPAHEDLPAEGGENP